MRESKDTELEAALRRRNLLEETKINLKAIKKRRVRDAYKSRKVSKV